MPTSSLTSLQSHLEHRILIFIHFYQGYVFSLITWNWCLTKHLLHAMTQLAHCWWHFLFLYVSVRPSHTSDSRGQDYTQMIYGCFVKCGLISLPHAINGFWGHSNTELWLVWVALIITAVSAWTRTGQLTMNNWVNLAHNEDHLLWERYANESSPNFITFSKLWMKSILLCGFPLWCVCISESFNLMHQ